MGPIHKGILFLGLMLIGAFFAVPNSVAGNVRLAWDASPQESVAGYYVYRSAESGKGFTRINPFLVRLPRYTDSSVSSGRTYYYAVTAVSNSGLESDFSKEVVAELPPNEPPVANDDQWATFVDTSARIPVLDNDIDKNGDRLSIVGVVGAGHSRININGKNIKYTPASGFSGTDSFQYLISDGEATSNWATVWVSVRLPGDVDGDGKIEEDDVSAIASSLKSSATGPADPRDLDQDGEITVLDLQAAYTRCENCQY